MNDDLPEFQPLQRLPNHKDPPPCTNDDCRWSSPAARAWGLYVSAVASARQLFVVSELARAHGDHLIADVIEDSIVSLSNSIQPYIDAHLNTEEA